jgi:hypothetical protein
LQERTLAVPIDGVSSRQSFYSSNVELSRKRGGDEKRYVTLNGVDEYFEDKEESFDTT